MATGDGVVYDDDDDDDDGDDQADDIDVCDTDKLGVAGPQFSAHILGCKRWMLVTWW